MKWGALFIIFKGLSLKLIKQVFLKHESPTLKGDSVVISFITASGNKTVPAKFKDRANELLY